MIKEFDKIKYKDFLIAVSAKYKELSSNTDEVRMFVDVFNNRNDKNIWSYSVPLRMSSKERKQLYQLMLRTYDSLIQEAEDRIDRIEREINMTNGLPESLLD